ncbi:hypothetical protein niasHS_004993 [Heterodera schachtii]|uniref:Uncharacterized protein n=1 Tax=Heterodera schachtii TaxID=97005 RepID=A0ABD2JQQ7_HETSC
MAQNTPYYYNQMPYNQVPYNQAPYNHPPPQPNNVPNYGYVANPQAPPAIAPPGPAIATSPAINAGAGPADATSPAHPKHTPYHRRKGQKPKNAGFIQQQKSANAEARVKSPGSDGLLTSMLTELTTLKSQFTLYFDFIKSQSDSNPDDVPEKEDGQKKDDGQEKEDGELDGDKSSA